MEEKNNLEINDISNIDKENDLDKGVAPSQKTNNKATAPAGGTNIPTTNGSTTTASVRKRTVPLVLGITFFILALILSGIALGLFYSGQGQSDGLVLAIFIVVYGPFIYLPAIIFNIVGIIMSRVAIDSDIKERKIIAKIFLILNILLLIGLILGLIIILTTSSNA